MINPNFNDPERYIDLAKWFEKQESYTDFEGMASTEGILEKAEKATAELYGHFSKEAAAVVRTILVHWMFQTRDTAGEECDPTDDDVLRAAECLSVFIGTRYLLREDAK
jgi:hypothetical protein